MRFKLLSLLLVGTLTIGNLHIIAYASEPSYDVILEASQGTSQDDVIEESTEDTSQDEVIEESTEDTSQDEVIEESIEDTSQDDVIDDLPEDFYTVYPTGGTIDIDPPVQIESVSDGRRGLLMADYLPSYYVTPNLPTLRKQSPYGTCWAFAAISLADINLMNSGIMPDADLSELHLAYFTYNTEADPLGGTAGDSIKMGAESTLNYGGRAEWGLNTFSRWIGAADEADVPYYLAGRASSEGLDRSLAYQDVAHVVNYYEEPISHGKTTISRSLHSNLKKMIMNYGAIAIDFYAYDSMAASYSDKIYNLKTNAYYNPDNPGGTNHSVAVVGWNDDFPKSDFAREAPGDGAFLVRNSWRAGDGSKNDYSYSGYFWMSYYESSIGANAYAAEFALSDNYDNNYQYDGGLTHAAIGVKKVANVFTTHAEGGDKGENLEAVGFYTASSNVRYTIDIYKNLSNRSNPESGTHVASATTTGITSYSGQYTIPLADTVYLEPNTTFSVVLSLDKSGDVAFGIEYSYSYGSISNSPGQSFLGSSSWSDLAKISKFGNLCIKAYTNNAADEGKIEEPDDLQVEPEEIHISGNLPERATVGETYHFSADVLPSSYEPQGTITWSTTTPTRLSIDSQTGTATVLRPGPCEVTATLDGVSETVSFDAYPAESDYGYDVDVDNTVSLWWKGSSDASAYRIYRGKDSTDYATVTATGDDEICTFTDEYYKNNYEISQTTYTIEYVIEGKSYQVLLETELRKIAEITYILNGGVNNPDNPEFYVIGATRDIYAPTNAKGYVFEGWYLDQAFSEDKKRSEIFSSDTTDIILYARFSKTNLSSVETEGIVSSFDYSGNEHRQENARLYMISGPERIYLEEGEDYRVSYEKDLINAGKKIITFTGIGGFTGTIEEEYTINAYNIHTDEQSDNPHITVDLLDKYGRVKEPDEEGLYYYTFNEESVKPLIVVRFRSGNREKTLIEKTDYIIEYANNARITEDEDFESDKLPTITIRGIGNFTGKLSRRFCILGDYAAVPTVPPEFVITYHCSGGPDNPYNRKGYDSEDETFEILEPVQDNWPDGYRFAGWYKEATYKTSVKEISTGTSGNIDLYAKWLPYTYIVHFEGNGATSGKTADQIYTYGVSKNLNANKYVKKGSFFIGWATSLQQADEGEVSYTNKQAVSDLIDDLREDEKEITLYAVWKNGFELSLDANGGELGSDVITSNDLTDENGVASGSYTYGKARALPTPQKDGYIFGGWYTDTTFKKRVSSITTATTGDLNLVAKWTPLSFVVSFNGNGANSGRMATEKFTYGNPAALRKNAFVKRGYRFAGWSLEKAPEEATGIIANQEEVEFSYVEGPFADRLIALGINKKNVTITLYAQWEETDYTITFETNGGELESNEYLTVEDINYVYSASYSYNHKGGYKLPDPAKSGFTFIGWYSDPDFKTRIKSIAQSSCSDMTLYARWNMNYRVVFNDGSGDGDNYAITGTMKDQIIKYDTNTALSKNRFKNQGYVFMGWAVSQTDAENGKYEYSDGQKIRRPDENYLSTDENGMFTLELYAVWKNSFVVTYILNGGSLTTEGLPVITEEYLEEYSLTDLPWKFPAADSYVLEKEGFTFGGWYSDPKLKTRVTSIPKNSSKDKVFYAKWNSRKYMITYDADKPQADRTLTGRMSKQTFSYGVSKALSKNVYKIKGYVFEGWSTLSYEDRIAAAAERLGMDIDETLLDIYDRELSRDDVEFSQGQKIDKIYDHYSENITLYAVWRKEVYSITYKNVTDSEMSVLTETYTVDDAVLFPEIQRIGYTFQGWYTNSNFKSRIKEVKSGTTGSKILYGKWVLNR